MSHFREIIGERLVLRKPDLSDWKEVSYLRTDPGVNQFVQRPSAETKEKAEEFLNMVITNLKEDKSYFWVISLKDDDKMIGSISLWNFSEDRKTAEVGYDLSPAFHGKGIMNEALEYVIKFGFEELNFDEIEAFTQFMNEKSIALLKRNGFQHNPERSDPDNSNNWIFELNQLS